MPQREKNGFQDRLSLYAVHKYCRKLRGSFLQFCRPTLSYRLPLRRSFCLFEWPLKTCNYFAEEELIILSSSCCFWSFIVVGLAQCAMGSLQCAIMVFTGHAFGP